MHKTREKQTNPNDSFIFMGVN